MGDHSSFVNHGFAKVDTGRKHRRGFPEVIYCEGKTPEEVLAISKTILAADGVVLGTRANATQFEFISNEIPSARFNQRARCIVIEEKPLPKIAGCVGVLCAGTSDLAVAEEAVETLEVFGNRVEKFFDVGVAGIHRLIAERDRIEVCNVLIVVAGMEGALPSAVAGLVSKPIIAVPTSVGYGASFGGLAALLGMLNSCGSGVTVVNIDNGFGAAYAAATINRLVHNQVAQHKAEAPQVSVEASALVEEVQMVQETEQTEAVEEVEGEKIQEQLLEQPQEQKIAVPEEAEKPGKIKPREFLF